MTQDQIDTLKIQWQSLKEYIFVLDIVDDHMVPVVVAHAVLTAHRHFQDNSMYKHWLRERYKKCVCKVNDAEMHKILNTPDVSMTTERNYGG